MLINKHVIETTNSYILRAHGRSRVVKKVKGIRIYEKGAYTYVYATVPSDTGWTNHTFAVNKDQSIYDAYTAAVELRHHRRHLNDEHQWHLAMQEDPEPRYNNGYWRFVDRNLQRILYFKDYRDAKAALMKAIESWNKDHILTPYQVFE